jgi:hypothetical protein
MRLIVALPWLVALAACEAGPPTALPAPHVSAGFPKGGLVNTIRIDAADRLPLHAVDLVAPDGSTTPASSIDVTAEPRTVAGQSVATDPNRGTFSSSGSIASMLQADPQANAALRSETQLLMTISTAQIPLLDPAAYRRDWQHYVIRAQLGSPGGPVETRELPAPQPPPG